MSGTTYSPKTVVVAGDNNTGSLDAAFDVTHVRTEDVVAAATDDDVGCVVLDHEPPRCDALTIAPDVLDVGVPVVIDGSDGLLHLTPPEQNVSDDSETRVDTQVYRTLADVSAGSTATGMTRLSDSPLEAETALTERLAASELEVATLVDILDNLDQVVWMISPDEGTLLYSNSALEKVYGLDRERLHEDRSAFLDIVHIDDRDRLRASLAAPAEGTYDETYRIVTDDGIRWLHARAQPVTNEAGEVTRIVGITEDVTDRTRQHQRVKALRSERELLRTVVESVPIVVYVLDADGVFQLSEGHGLAALGLEPGEVVGSSVFEQYADRPDLLSHVQRSLNGETVHATVEAGPLTFESWLQPIFDEEGHVTHVCGASLDITRRRRAEETLAPYLTAFETVGDPLYMLDESGRFTVVNGAMTRLVGRDCAELVGASAQSVFDEEDVTRLNDALAAVETADEIYARVELDLDTPRGVEHFEVKVAPITASDGTQTGSVGILRDITARIRQRQQLQVLSRVLRHDMRNNLNTVMLGVEALAEQLSPSPYDDLLAIIAANVDKTVELGNTIRGAQQMLEQGEIQQTTVDLNATVTELVAGVERDFPAATLSVDVGHDLVSGSTLLDLAVDNVLRNAVEHSDRPEPRVSVWTTRDESHVTLHIADDGPGIPAYERRVIERGEESPLEHLSGMGLWLSHWIVAESGGQLTFDANQPRGSVVRLHLQGRRDGTCSLET